MKWSSLRLWEQEYNEIVVLTVGVYDLQEKYGLLEVAADDMSDAIEEVLSDYKVTTKIDELKALILSLALDELKK
jgi:hypothetical protein